MILLNKNFLIFFLAALISMLHWPSFFSHAEVATIEIRYSVWLLAILVMITQFNFRLSFFEIFIFTLILLFILIEFYLNINHQNNIYSYYSTLILIMIYYNYLKSDKHGSELFVRYWIRLSIIILFFSIIVFLLHNLSLKFDPLNFGKIFMHPFRINADTFSLFGKSSFKEDFLNLINVERSSGYFNEPGDLGFFAMINLLIIKVFYETNIFSINNNKKIYSTITILAGMVSLSFTFYISLAILFFLEIANSRRGSPLIMISFGPIIFLLIIIFPFINELLTTSSFSDRFLRFNCGFILLGSADVVSNLFGLGLEQTCDLYLDRGKYGSPYNPGFSSGYIKTAVGRGIISLIFILFILYMVLRKNKTVFFFYLLYFLVLSWNTQYIFLFLMLVFFAINHHRNKKLYL